MNLADFALKSATEPPAAAGGGPSVGSGGNGGSMADFAFGNGKAPEADYSTAISSAVDSTLAAAPAAPKEYIGFDKTKSLLDNYGILGGNVMAFMSKLPTYSKQATDAVNSGIDTLGGILGDNQFMKNFAEASTRGKAAMSGQGSATPLDAAASEIESTLNVLSHLGLSSIKGATGGIVAPTAGEQKAPDATGNFVLGAIDMVGQGLGMMGTIGGLAKITAPLTTPAGFVDFLNQYPHVAKYAIPLIQNAASFSIYGQLDPQLADDMGARAHSFLIDVGTAPIYTALGMIKSAKYSLPASFGLGFGMAKLSGADNANAVSSGIAFALLDGVGRAGAPKFVDTRNSDEALKAEAMIVLSKYSGMKVTTKTSPEDLQLAWRRAAKATHPDLGGTAADFTRARTAYEFITGEGKTFNAKGEEANAPEKTVHEDGRQALLEDATKALKANHTPEEVAAEMTKQMSVPASHANDIVAEAAQSAGINIPGIFDSSTANDEVMSAVKAAQEAVQAGKTGEVSPAEKKAAEHTDAQIEADVSKVFGDTKEPVNHNAPDRVEEILAEMSDSQDMADDWVNNHAVKYGEQSSKVEELMKQIKDTKDRALRNKLQEKVDKISAEMAHTENDFVDKYRAEAEKKAAEEAMNEKVAQTEVRASTPEERRAEWKAALENPKEVEKAKAQALKSILRGHVEEREKRMEKILAEKDVKKRAAAFHKEMGLGGGATLGSGFSWDYSPGKGLRITHYEADKPVLQLSNAQLLKAALDEYAIMPANGKDHTDLGGDIRPGEDSTRSKDGGDGQAERGGAGEEHRGELAPRERSGSSAGTRKRSGAPVKGDEPLAKSFTSDAEPKGEQHVPVKDEYAVAVAKYYGAVHDALGIENWEVDEHYATKGGAISAGKTFNAAGPAVAGDVNLILWKKDSDYGIYLSSSGVLTGNTIELADGRGGFANLMYRATRKDIKYTGFTNQWADMTKMRPSELAPILQNLVDRQEEFTHRPTEERVAEVEADAEEQRVEKDVTNESLKALAEAHTAIDPDGEVRILDDVPFVSDDELRDLNLYTGAGGKEKEGAEGRGLLDEYYTPGDITTMVGTLLERLGAFRAEGMHILEPSAGTGAFLGDIPDHATVDAHEINPTAAAILKLNYPNVTVSTKPFEDRFMGERGQKKQVEPKYDLVIGNPPYGEHRGRYKGMGEERSIAKYEEYFIKRALDITIEGGHVAMVVPSGFLRGADTLSKVAIAQRGDLIDAYRLPNGAFPTTSIGTDILIFKRNDHLSTAEKPNVQILIDDTYFNQHPEKVLGAVSEKKGRFGMEPWIEGTIESAADKFFGAVDENTAIELVPTGERENDEAITGTQDELAEAYKTDHYAEVREMPTVKETAEVAEKKLTTEEKKAVAKNAKARISSPKKTEKILDMALLSTTTPEEAALWKYVQPTGELKGDFKKEDAYLYKGQYYNAFNYLQGDVYDKLDALELDKKGMSAEQYAKQKTALEAIKPVVQPLERISITPNSRFANEFIVGKTHDNVPISIATNFMKWLDDLPHQAFGDSSRWAIKGYVQNQPVRGGDKVSNEAERRTRRIEGDRLFGLYLKDEISAEERAKVLDAYNRAFNSYARPDYLGVPFVTKLHSTFLGKKLELRDVQLQGIGFLVNRGVGLLAHDVGIGKTMQGIIANAELIARGWAKKPLIVVPNINVYNQWVREIQELVPDVKINLLANLGGDFKGDLASLEIPEGSISLVTEEGFKRLGFRDETYDGLTRDFNDVIVNPNEKKTARQKEKEKAQASEQMGKGVAGTSEDRYFEDLGFDYLTVDEVHNANHIIPKAKIAEGKVSEFRAFNVQPSIYGIKTWLAAQYIQKMQNGRGFIGLSATPFTNNPLEYYSVLSLMARERMQRMGILNVNDFMTMFMNISTELEFKANGDYIEKSEVRSFKNYQQFQKLLTEFIDFKDGADAGVVRPDRLSREYTVAQSEDGFRYSQQAQDLFKDTKHAGALKAIGELRAVAFSPYLSRYHDGVAPTPSTLIEGSPKLKAMTTVIRQTLKDNPDAGHLIYTTIGVEYIPLIKQYFIDEKIVRADQIDIISGSTPKPKRSAIQESFNTGALKIVLGSDAIMEGVNLQRNTSDLHILSLPWNFTSLRQVIGRAWRQGNRWSKIRVNNYFTENSVDTFLSQKLQNKEKRYEESLKFKGDTLDVGDIDFDELKFDLITDPVARVELEYKFKQQELEHTMKQKISELAYKNRRAAELIDAQKRVTSAKSLAVQYDWAKPDVKKAEDKLAETLKKLQDRGIDVHAIQKELEDSDKEVAAMKKRIEGLTEEKKTEMVKAASARAVHYEVPKTDYTKIAAERQEDNTTFYKGGPFFERYNSAVDGASPETWPAELDRIFTTDEMNAIIRAAYGQELALEEIKAYKTATKKYLDYKAKPAFERALSTSIVNELEGRVTVSRQFVEDLAKRQEVKKAEKEAVAEALAEMPIGEMLNVELFASKVIGKLLPLTLNSDMKAYDKAAMERDIFFKRQEASGMKIQEYLEKNPEEKATLESLNAAMEKNRPGAFGSDALQYEFVNLPADKRGTVARYEEHIFRSPIANSAGNVHFRGETHYFAHTRLEDIADTSDETFDKNLKTEGGNATGYKTPSGVRRMLEIQSDLFQRGRYEDQKDSLVPIEQAIEDGKYEYFEGEGDTRPSYKVSYPSDPNNENHPSVKFPDYEVISKEKFEALKKGIAEKKARDAELEKLAPYRNTWHERIVREEIRNAANDDMTALRFPTGKTALEIEGLSRTDGWALAEDRSKSLKASELEVGQVIVPDTSNMGDFFDMDVDATSFVITDILGDGKFKVMPKAHVDSYAETANLAEGMTSKDILAYAEHHATDNFWGSKETFDISGEVDVENPIYRFYENEMQRYLRKIRPDLARITDEKGVEWFETQIDATDKVTPVLAFQRTPFQTFKAQATTFAEAKGVLDAYKARLGLDFDVDFANAIFTGEYAKVGFERGKVGAYGVTYNNKITLIENVTRTTADHEFVHLVAANLENIPAFAGITRTELLRAMNGGRDFTTNDIEKLEEKLAVGFEEFVAGRAQKQANIVMRFFQMLKDLLTDLMRALGRDIGTVKDFYDRLARTKGGEVVKLESDRQLDADVRVSRTGQDILDFGLVQRRAEFDMPMHQFFEKIPDIMGENDGNMNLIRKDINSLENMLAQARDIYLKDPNEFASAKQYEKIGDERRMKKAELDKKWSKMMDPYFKGLDKSGLEKVNKVLMQGDLDGKEYDDSQLRSLNLNEAQIAAYKSVRLAFNIAQELLTQKMIENGVNPEEVEQYQAERVGYMPHKWQYRFVVKIQEQTGKGSWRTVSMDNYKSERAAKTAWEEMKAQNQDNTKRFILDTLDNLEVDFFTEQRLSFEAMKTIMAQARTGEDVKKAMIEALRNMAKEKGFGRHFIRRTGVLGYEQKEVPMLIANYFSGMDGYITKMEAGKRYYDALSTVDARRQAKYYGWLRDAIAYDMGNTKEWSNLKQLAFAYYLANDVSFLLTNATQNFTVGMGELSKHLEGAEKLLGPEAYMLKAMTDWATGNVTPEEKAVITQLIELGRLGGEQTSEMMGFKNNPLYTEISSTFSKAMYHSTAWVEQNVNRAPAFLAARRVFKDKGLSDKEANEKALEVSEDIHFRYGKQHRAKFERGKSGILFVFYHYMRSLLFQLYRDLSEQEFAAFTRKMLYTAALGGTASLPFGQSLVAIYRAIFGAGCTAGKDGDCQMGQEMPLWEIALTRGLPALSGVDLSGRVGIDIFSISSIVNNPQDVKSYIGGVGNLLWVNPGDSSKSGRLGQGVALLFQDRIADAMAKLLPDFAANPIKGYEGYQWGVRSFAGTPLLDGNGEAIKYNSWEAIVRATGFTPTREGIAYDARAKEFVAQDDKAAASTNVRRTIQGQLQRGEYDKARQTQTEALAAGTIGAGTDYVRSVGRSIFMKNALDAWTSSDKSSIDIHEGEKQLLSEIYGPKPTDDQKNTVRKDFAVARTFGLHDKVVNSIIGAATNADRVEILKAAKASMGDDAFAAFYRKARKTVTTQAGNDSAILISDDLDDLYHGRVKP